MPEDPRVTTWLDKLSDGNEQGAEVIWREYFDKLVRLADRRLGGMARRAASEEDVALSAMNSFFRGVREGRFTDLAGREDLWKLLVTITVRKVCQAKRRHLAQKRGSGQIRGESVFTGRDDLEGDRREIAQVLGREPTPAMAAQFTEDVERLLDLLGDAGLRDVALLKLEGYSNAEIASRLDKHVTTIERKLRAIRQLWAAWGEEHDDHAD